MGGRVGSTSESRKRHGSITSALASALLEWLLMFMLFVDAVFGYIITEFARYCDLPIPCLLCSRIDHILGREKAGFYWDLICGKHKLEISSSVFCHFHEKLVDVRGMCETCLFSFATKDKSNAETYRLLVGKLGAEDLSGIDEDPLLDVDHNKPESSSSKCCSCCNELWTTRSHAQTLLQTKSMGFDTNDLKEEAKTVVEGETADSSVHYGYTELKITSDTESEIQASDNEDTGALISNDPLRDLILDSSPIKPFINVSEDDSACKKQLDIDVISPEPSQTLCQVQLDTILPQDAPSVVSAPAIGHGLEELNWHAIDHKSDQSAPADLVIVDHAPQSSNAGNSSTDFLKDGSDNKKAGIVQTMENKAVEALELESLQITADLNCSKTRSDHTDSGCQMQNGLELGDAYKLAIGSRRNQLSSKLSEQLTAKDSTKVSEDLKILLTQMSRGFELPSNDILTPRVSRNVDELKLLQKKLSLERNDSRTSLDRNESGFESLDMSTVSEVEGETELDRLKRQLDHDRKFMIEMLKELEEERNASATAVNEAMAMITRLQEEKASLQMEASHGLRMMEEQAEYDMEALEKLNELLAEKEREIQDLEAELEHLRTNEERNSKESWLENDDEREYISRCLDELEKKISLLCDDTVHSELINGDHLENNEEVRQRQRKLLQNGDKGLVQEIVSDLEELRRIAFRRHQDSSRL